MSTSEDRQLFVGALLTVLLIFVALSVTRAINYHIYILKEQANDQQLADKLQSNLSESAADLEQQLKSLADQQMSYKERTGQFATSQQLLLSNSQIDLQLSSDRQRFVLQTQLRSPFDAQAQTFAIIGGQSLARRCQAAPQFGCQDSHWQHIGPPPGQQWQFSSGSGQYTYSE